MIGVRFRKLANGEYSCYLDIYVSGKRASKFLPYRFRKDYSGLYAKHGGLRKSVKAHPEDIEKLKELRELYLQAELDFARGSLNLTKPKKNIWEELVKLAGDKKHATYTAMLKHLAAYKGKDDFDNDYDWFQGFKSYLENSGLSQKSPSVYFDRLKILVRELIQTGKLDDSPISKVKNIKKVKKEKNSLKVSELEKLYANASTPLHYAFLFSCYTGLRISDILALSWSQIEGGMLTYTAVKTDKKVAIPLHTTALQIINKTERSGERVFPLNTGNNLYNRELRVWAESIGLAPFTFHAARHTFVSLIVEYTGNILLASKLAGHSNVGMTEAYAHASEPQYIAAIKSLPELG